MATIWRCREHVLSLERTLITGILNVTPDSFSDGGRFYDTQAAIKHGISLAQEGADIVDVGGESTRPGAEAVSVDEELARVVSVVAALAQEGICVSIDTQKSQVAAACLDAGAAIVNDVSAGQFDPDMLKTAATAQAGIVLMHMRGQPRTMQAAPHYENVVSEVIDFLASRAAEAREAGCQSDQIVIDPGIGFGKTVDHNLALLAHVGELVGLGYPVMIGTSRKSMFGKLFNLDVSERLIPSLVTEAWSVFAGASVVRVHDVAASKIALALADKLVSEHDKVRAQ